MQAEERMEVRSGDDWTARALVCVCGHADLKMPVSGTLQWEFKCGGMFRPWCACGDRYLRCGVPDIEEDVPPGPTRDAGCELHLLCLM